MTMSDGNHTVGALALKRANRESMRLNGDLTRAERFPQLLVEVVNDQPGECDMNGFDPKEFGRLQAQVEQLLQSDKVKTELLQTLTVLLQSMQLQMAEAKGGWRALMMLGGASASFGGIITWALSHFFTLPGAK
jgi:hypothetical protein